MKFFILAITIFAAGCASTLTPRGDLRVVSWQESTPVAILEKVVLTDANQLPLDADFTKDAFLSHLSTLGVYVGTQGDAGLEIHVDISEQKDRRDLQDVYVYTITTEVKDSPTKRRVIFFLQVHESPHPLKSRVGLLEALRLTAIALVEELRKGAKVP